MVWMLALCVVLGVAIPRAAEGAKQSKPDKAVGGAATATPEYAYPLDTCVVSGDKLGGSMGKPVNFDYKGREVRFCCKACIKDFKKDPAKYLKKLDDAVISQQKPTYPLGTCVVTGQKLDGPMGAAIDYVYKNRLVRFCCKSCPAKFNQNPDKYLALIDKARAAKKTP